MLLVQSNSVQLTQQQQQQQQQQQIKITEQVFVAFKLYIELYLGGAR
jgi:hypothetical protein